jgi:hypothetical protein
MTNKARTGLVALVILAFPFALFLTFLYSDLVRSSPPAKPLPNPNLKAVPQDPVTSTNQVGSPP